MDDANDYISLGSTHFDNYDIEALKTALAAFDSAAENTYTDLREDPKLEPTARRIWTSIRLARIALFTAFQGDLNPAIRETLDHVSLWATEGEPQLSGPVMADLVCAISDSQSPVGSQMDAYGDLWPTGTPEGWAFTA